MTEPKVFTVPADDWGRRLNQAAFLSAHGQECAVCGGTGGWPGLFQFVVCRPCVGSGFSRELLEFEAQWSGESG